MQVVETLQGGATMDTQGRGVESEVESHAGVDVVRDGRRFRSPQRVLVRSFRMNRDNWKIITAIVASHLCARPTAMRHARVEAELITFARHESASARPGERLVGSSEVEESVFGKLKTLEGDQCSSGFTRYVLSLGAVVGDWTTARIKDALDKTPVKLVKAWCKAHLPVSVPAQRRLAFSPQIVLPRSAYSVGS